MPPVRSIPTTPHRPLRSTATDHAPSNASAPAASVAVVLLLVIGAAANVWFVVQGPLDLSGDEAHYWEWSRRLDFSYYSKGPLVAYLIAGGTALLGDTELGVRAPAIVLSVLTGWGIFVLARRSGVGPWSAFAAVALLATMPITAVGAKLMTIDAPLLCAWIWMAVSLERALATRGWLWWVLVGLLIAVGLLAKYNMLFAYPAIAVILLSAPEVRHWLRRPQPYVAACIGTLGLAPIVVWNAWNGWVSFRHVAGQAGVDDAPVVEFVGVLTYLGGQLAVVNPVWFVLIVWACIVHWRSPEPQPRWRSRMLVVLTLTPWLIFLGFSPLTKIQPNWPVLALVTGVIVLAQALANGWRSRTPGIRRRTKATVGVGVVYGVVALVLLHNTAWLMPIFKRLAADAPPWELTPTAVYDPTSRLRGWEQLGAAVGAACDEARVLYGEPPFILTDDYQLASLLAFYTPGQPSTYAAASVLGRRRSQYDLWRNPIDDAEAFVGRPVVYVGTFPAARDERGALLRTAFEDVAEPRIVTHTVAGAPVRVTPIYRVRTFNGFPARARAATVGY